jgi:hypothetical protein
MSNGLLRHAFNQLRINFTSEFSKRLLNFGAYKIKQFTDELRSYHITAHEGKHAMLRIVTIHLCRWFLWEVLLSFFGVPD